MFQPTDITTSTLSHWMVEYNMSRAGLAGLLGLSKACIDRWMCYKSIPASRCPFIAQVLNDYQARSQDHLRVQSPYGGVRAESSLYTADEWARLHKAAELLKISTEEFQKRAVVWAMKMIVHSPFSPEPAPHFAIEEDSDSEPPPTET